MLCTTSRTGLSGAALDGLRLALIAGATVASYFLVERPIRMTRGAPRRILVELRDRTGRRRARRRDRRAGRAAGPGVRLGRPFARRARIATRWCRGCARATASHCGAGGQRAAPGPAPRRDRRRLDRGIARLGRERGRTRVRHRGGAARHRGLRDRRGRSDRRSGRGVPVGRRVRAVGAVDARRRHRHVRSRPGRVAQQSRARRPVRHRR